MMKYMLSKKWGHADCLSKLISKNVEPFEDNVITALWAENEILNVLCNVICELPDIRSNLEKDKFIIKDERNSEG